jgi:hypothetical protein
MDSSPAYGYQDLIRVYIETQRKDSHPDFKNYYTGLLTHLEQLFEINFASPPSTQRALSMLFRTTIDSYLSLRTPWSGFLEAGLIVKKIQALGPQGEEIFSHSDQIEETTQTSREHHLQLLFHLCEAIYGKRDRVVTSQELAARGFDTSKEPRIEDYW